MSTPKPPIDKAESRRIRVDIRHVLLDVWDPIGVKNEPYAQDEYDGYLGSIYELLVNGASDRELEEHLHWIVDDRMGLGKSFPRNALTVAALRKISIPSS
jgi:hypothetical protein